LLSVNLKLGAKFSDLLAVIARNILLIDSRSVVTNHQGARRCQRASSTKTSTRPRPTMCR
jgi:hypothetical protein